MMNTLLAGEYAGEITRQVKIADAIVSTTEYSVKHSNVDWHSHENLHACLVFQSGKSQNRNAEKYANGKGTIFVYRSGEEHRWISNESVSRSLNIELGFEFLNANDLSDSGLKDTILNRKDAKLLMLKMQSEVLKGECSDVLETESLLIELFTTEATVPVGNRPRWVVDLKALLHEEWNRELRLAELSEILGVHPVTISRYFRKYFGCSLGEYRRKLRLEKSVGMIKGSTKSLAEIAIECGFADQSHFTRNFKSATGFLPKNFRKL